MDESELSELLELHYDAMEWDDGQYEYVCSACGARADVRLAHVASVALIAERGQCTETHVWHPGDENVRLTCSRPAGHDGRHQDATFGARDGYWPEDDE